MPKVKKICISEKRGIKSPVDTVKLINNFGIEGDAHAKINSDRQVSILPEYLINDVKDKGIDIKPGDFGENLIIDDIDIKNIGFGIKFYINDVILEVTKIGKECPHPCSIYKQLGMCIMPEAGIFCKVIKGGSITNGDSVNYS